MMDNYISIGIWIYTYLPQKVYNRFVLSLKFINSFQAMVNPATRNKREKYSVKIGIKKELETEI